LPVDPPSSAALDGVSRHDGPALPQADAASFEPAVAGLLSSWDAVGMMIIGRHFDDATVLRVAHAFEHAVGGFSAPRAATQRSSK
jgi:hypothetical protein